MERGDAFELALRTRLVYGCGAIARLGELAREIGGERVLVVTDHGVAAAGHPAIGEATLTEAGFTVQHFEDVHENPTTHDVDACLAVAKEFRPDLIVGLGGGSSMDVAKGTNFLYICGGRMRDYWGVGKAGRPMLPMIAVPTTAGTGSEAQSFALIIEAETRQKLACGDSHAAPRVALLDPELTLTQPPLVTACTGLDALGHAVETAVTSTKNPVSSLFSREAFRLLARAFPRVLEDPDDIDSRGAMLRGAAFAGLAIENSMLGAAHSMANPLTKHFGLPHGQAVAVSLPHVVAFNREDAESSRTYAELAAMVTDVPAVGDAGQLVDALRGFLARAGFPTSLADCGVGAGDVPALAREAAEQWTAQFNPRAVDAGAFERLFTRALE